MRWLDNWMYKRMYRLMAARTLKFMATASVKDGKTAIQLTNEMGDILEARLENHITYLEVEQSFLEQSKSILSEFNALVKK